MYILCAIRGKKVCLLMTNVQSWQEHNPIEKLPDIDTDTLKEAVIKDLSYVSKMDVKEYTLYQKWCEVHDKYPTEEVNSFFDDKPALKNPEQGALLQEIKNNFWLPEDQEEYLYLEPELLWTDGDDVKSITGANMPFNLEWYENVFIYYEKQ